MTKAVVDYLEVLSLLSDGEFMQSKKRKEQSLSSHLESINLSMHQHPYKHRACLSKDQQILPFSYWKEQVFLSGSQGPSAVMQVHMNLFSVIHHFEEDPRQAPSWDWLTLFEKGVQLLQHSQMSFFQRKDIAVARDLIRSKLELLHMFSVFCVKKEQVLQRVDWSSKKKQWLRSSLYRCIKDEQASLDFLVLLGCSPQELKAHLESQFKEGMSWENWGLDGWHVDHVQPLASFDLLDRDQLKAANHFSNLQPLWAEENLSKGSKVNWGLGQMPGLFSCGSF